ncbi:MAG: hypothetical protein EXQ80_04985 [Candidatus Nanopelagicaceae bacterium]|nr:hypothetical protein [Candidatus Nanopelagicaceae bacterium]
MKSKALVLVLGLVLTLLPTFPASAAIKAGDKCSKLKTTAMVSGKKYTCIKSGPKFVWSKGVKVATSTSQPEDSSQPESPSSTKSPEKPCPTPLLQTPVDLSKVTSILYPGQERGGNYKAHGGFGFDNATDNLVTVKIPLSGKITRVVRYREMGEIQYLFEFDGNCGVSFRFDHLRKLTAKFEAVVSAFPIKEDTRTDSVSPPVAVMVGEVIATEVGFLNNVSVDFGVYDMRQKNEASKDPTWASAHSQFPADSYGICWFNSLPQADSAAVKLLPSRDGKNGKTSDYCK